MAYNPSLLTATDRLRFAVGDTTTDAELLPDETYTAVLAASGNDETKATIAIADALVTRYAQEATRMSLDGGKTEAEWKERIAAWRGLAHRLREELLIEAATTTRSSLRSLSPVRADRPSRSDYYRGD